MLLLPGAMAHLFDDELQLHQVNQERIGRVLFFFS